jgi:hypothetical protein
MTEEKLKETLSKLFNNINSRLTALEEHIQQSDVVLDERKVPERIGELGGKTLTKSGDGIQKLIRQPFCDICRVQLKEELALCECGRKVCLNCAITYEQAIYCPICIEEMLPISKKTYKVLLAIRDEITSIGNIKKLSKMRKDEIKTAIAELLQHGLVVKDGFFKRLRVTDDGLVALDLCSKIYDKEVDVAYLQSEIAKSKV